MDEKQQELSVKSQSFPKWLGRITAVALFALAILVALVMSGSNERSTSTEGRQVSQPQSNDTDADALRKSLSGK